MNGSGLRSFAWRSRGLDLLACLLAGALMLAPNSGLKSAVIWIAFLCVLVHVFRTGTRFRMGGIGWFVGLYLAACAASVVFSIDMRFSSRQLVKLIESIAAFAVLIALLSPSGRLSRGLRQFGFSMGLIATADFVRLAWGAVNGSLVLDNGRWFDSLLGFPTIAAGMFGVGLVVILTNAVREQNGWQRLMWCAFALQIVVLLYWLQTRSVLLGLSAAIFTFLLLGPLARRLQLSILLAGAAVIALFVLIPGTFRDRILSGSFTERKDLWSDASRIMEVGTQTNAARRWVGFGYGHRIFEKLHSNLKPSERQASRVYDHAHNMMVEARIQTGWVGLAALVSFWFALLWLGLRHRPPRELSEKRINFAGLAAALVLLLIYAQFSLIFAYLPSLLLWALPAAYLSSLQLGPE